MAVPSPAQQGADPAFKAIVDNPAYTKTFPRVLFDEGHNNFNTRMGRYKPFADLIEMDGYQIVLSRKTFSKESLETFKILIIADALGAEEVDDEGAGNPAFADNECDAVRDWVKSGGALLLIAGPAPFGSAAEILAKRFSVDMGKGITRDPANHEKEYDDQSWIIYSRDNKLLLDHPITAGRNDTEKISRVIAFSGQSLKGPEGSSVILKLADTANDASPRGPGGLREVNSAVGRAQGIAVKFGKGRIVVLGEAGMLSAQLSGHERSPVGINYPGIDNKQLALNIMHWLSGLLKER
ncbi:MAG: hypothetical protein JWM21_366 [Acidobacteria bacterium]|nr:hypothetical protein [Acidobacteriota bacterium]